MLSDGEDEGGDGEGGGQEGSQVDKWEKLLRR